MSARAAQTGAVQGDGEERNEAVQSGTASEPRSRQRSNTPVSAGGVGGSADEQASAVHGSLNQYEVAVLYHPDLEIDLEKASSKIEKIIKDNDGKIVKTDNWGRRKLAYPIKKQEFAVYVFYTVEMPAENVKKVEQTFNITDEIIRFLITRPDLKALEKAEALRADKAKKAAERGESEEEDGASTDEE
ncbi:MAG TPA: 30S ribosomal protein S6 [Candidatus Saccharimonadales bacterium]